MRHEAGLTLIELTFAILILAASLTVLLGLQSTSLRLASHDRSAQRAMLMARRILAPLETTHEPLENMDVSGKFSEILNKVASYDDEGKEPRDEDSYTVHLQISDWGIPDIDEKALKEVQLNFSWGYATEDQLNVVYFLPSEEGEQQDNNP